MAKNKAPLTPEQAEIKVMKKEKNSQNFIKVIAVLLALVLTAGVVFVGKTTADKAIEEAGQNVVVNGGETNAPADDNATDVPSGDVTDVPSEDVTDAPAGNDAPTPDAPAGNDAPTPNAPAGNDAPTPNAPVDNKPVDAVALLNKVTKEAAKGSYDWTRVCAFTPNGKIDVGNATDTLNGIISRVDENASLDSVVGGFLGIGNKEAKVANGKFPPTGMSTQDYMLKGMSITAQDLQGAAQVNGDVYTFNLKSCNNPKKTNNNALYRATNDFFTHEEVQAGLKSQLGALANLLSLKSSNVDYTNIKVVATIKADKLTNLEISYTFAAELSLQATLVPITGKGEATNTMKYFNIKY